MGEHNANGTNGTLASNRAHMDRFLGRLRESGNVRLACEAADVARSTVYRWREKWSTFGDEWQDALDDALDLLEAEAWRRARKSSDRLLMFLLKAHRREVYGDVVRNEFTGKDGDALTVRFVWDDRDIDSDADAAQRDAAADDHL